MSNEISGDEAARLGCAGFGCGIALLPILFIGLAAVLVMMLADRV